MIINPTKHIIKIQAGENMFDVNKIDKAIERVADLICSEGKFAYYASGLVLETEKVKALKELISIRAEIKGMTNDEK